MKIHIHSILPVILAFGAATSVPAQSDPVRDELFPPEIIMQKAGEIGVTDTQIAKLQAIMSEVHQAGIPKVEKIQNLQKQLTAVLKVTPVDRENASELFQELLKVEHDLKVERFSAMVEIRNLLTPEQLEKARKIKASLPPPNPKIQNAIEKRIKPKIEKVMTIVKADAGIGIEPPVMLQDDMHQVHEFLQAGKIDAAEAKLDEILKGLNAE